MKEEWIDEGKDQGERGTKTAEWVRKLKKEAL
jgi:hypothetical protein